MKRTRQLVPILILFSVLLLIVPTLTLAQSGGGITTKEFADKATDEVRDGTPLYTVICVLGIIAALVVAGFKWQTDSPDKGRILGIAIGAIIFFGLALFAINRL